MNARQKWLLIEFLSMFPLVVAKGFVLTVLWGWFIVPFGVDTLNIPTALGLMLLLRYVVRDVSTKAKRGFEDIQYDIVTTCCAVPLVLVIGWAIHLFSAFYIK